MNESNFDLARLLDQSPNIFKDENVFEPNYIPERLIHRQKELTLLANHFKSIIHKSSLQSGKQVVIQGSVGLGKTVVVKQFGHTLEEYCRKNIDHNLVKLLFLHINCRKQRSWYLIFTSILRRLVPAFPVRGFSTEELLTYLIQILGERNETLLLCLDEIDYLLSEPKGQDILYSLIRHYEGLTCNEGAHISFIFVTRNLYFQNMLDIALQSSLAQQIIYFEPYKIAQLSDILSYRAQEGLKEGVYSKVVIDQIASLGFKKGDARFAIELLWRSAKIAEKEGAKKINCEFVRRAQVSIFPIKQTLITDLPSQLKLILLALAMVLEEEKTRPFVTTSELKDKYEELCMEKKTKPRKQTQFWMYLKELAKMGLIELEVHNQHHEGKSAGRTALIGIPDLPLNEIICLLQ